MRVLHVEKLLESTASFNNTERQPSLVYLTSKPSSTRVSTIFTHFNTTYPNFQSTTFVIFSLTSQCCPKWIHLHSNTCWTGFVISSLWTNSVWIRSILWLCLLFHEILHRKTNNFSYRLYYTITMLLVYSSNKNQRKKNEWRTRITSSSVWWPNWYQPIYRRLRKIRPFCL